MHSTPNRASVTTLPPLSQRLLTFALWGTLVGVAFFGIYPTTNWLTSLRETHYPLYFDGELGIPFVPAFIWLYLSMYVLFALPPFFLDNEQLKRLAKELVLATIASGVIFMAVPAQLGFSRVLPAGDFYRTLYQGMFSVDQPFNLVPSLHVVYSTSIFLAIATRASVRVRILLWAWLVLLVASTMLVHQHHLLDVVTGLLLAFLSRAILEKKNV
jgi:membrane-associated phospholipid phosphatase